ncbi:DNA primase large subunit [Condylostylus longicornis]|uniref:DNA primase large subunit n=1 Tax=Condylostylus longicornis TaxID=2530218 RepID=UPI00244E4769|nr:DNA primase large subunit [Condylostylus longicornis]
MDFSRKSRVRVERKPEYENLENLYPFNVLLYRLPPLEEIKIQEFEDLALERLKVLRIFEQAGCKNLRFLSDEYKENIVNELNREGLKGYVRLLSGGSSTKKDLDLQARRRDYISHFILRLGYCRSQDLKKWFIAREMELFRYKFSSLMPQEIKQFLAYNKMNYVPLSQEQKEEIKDGLLDSTFGRNLHTIEANDFYKVSFLEVLDLVRSRKCFLKKGYAYVSSNDFISIVAAKHQAEIEHGLIACQKLLPEVENDERIYYLLKGLHTSYTGKDYALTKSGQVPIEAIDQLSKKSFPLCMRVCHEVLRTTHHHKHGGRMQYGLFLKGIGVTLEDSLRFWREEFVKQMDIDKFEKSYAYNIRHNYGKEGSMVNYTPYSCMKIITSSVGSQTYGCPFKHFDTSALKLKLTSYGLSAAAVQEVMNYAQRGHYQIACGKYFEITHDTKLDHGITHPNLYFEESQIIQGNRAPQTSKTPTAAKKTSNYKKNSEALLMNVDDDDELWNTAENEETELAETQKKEVWGNDDDFDVSQVESMDM